MTAVASAQKGVFISTYGCQMNNNDTERMYSLLEISDYFEVDAPEKADLIIVNSCSVREKPLHKVSSEIGKYRELKANNPNLRIGVGGCVAQQEKQKLFKSIPLLDFVFGTDAIDQLPDLVERAQSAQRLIEAKATNAETYSTTTLVRNPSVSAFVNITKGCDNFCTFCVVPFTRGRERSRKLSELLEDIQKLTSRGVQEVTLLGQNVNSYSSECGADFAKLMQEVALQTSITRIRYTTSHPKDFNQELIDVSAKYRDKIMDYVHLPMQSGNSEVLQRMNRGYSREEYIEKVDMIRSSLPGVALSTDIIVGFPGETDAQFEDTLSLMQKVQFENVFAFKYSPRPFTKAAQFKDQVPEEIKSERLTRLLAMQTQISWTLTQEYQGRQLKVLVDEIKTEKQLFSGRSTQNRLVQFPIPDSHLDNPGATLGKILEVKITKVAPSILRGEMQ